MKILTVIPFIKGPFVEELTYFSAKDIPLGSIVEITLRNKNTLGLVLASEDAIPNKADLKELNFNLKKITEVKEHTIFSTEYLKAIIDSSNYFLSRKNDGITALIPQILKEEYEQIEQWLSHNIDNKSDGITKNLRAEKLLFQSDFENRISYYKTLIRSSFAEKKSIFVVVPTDDLVKKFESLLSKGIEQFTFTFSSKSSNRSQKTKDKLKSLIQMKHPVLIIGTPPYLALPRFDFCTIILEEESNNNYKMQFPPFYDLRVFVEIFATLAGVKLIFADTLLRFETYARIELDYFTEVAPLSFRLSYPAKIIMLPRETERNKRKFSIFTSDNIENIRLALTQKENVFIFSLRKGLATYTICRDCNDIIMCDKCSAPLVLYLSKDGKKRMFICNRCSHEKDPETRCRLCGSWNLLPLGIGTDLVCEELKRNFPKIKIFKLDKEEVENAKEAHEIIKEFENSKGALLVGTQMALYYLKNHVPVTIVASFDSLWSIPNFQMGEKIIQLINSLLQKTEKKLVIISKNIKDSALISIINENILAFVRSDLEDRKSLGYPPYYRFIKINHFGNKEETIEIKKYLRNLFEGYDLDIFSGFITKQRDKYSTNAIIKLERKKWSLPSLTSGGTIDEELSSRLRSLPAGFSISIDPENLL